MAALSKYYSDIMKSNAVTCAHVLHPDTSCSYFLVKTLFTTIFRVSQFFFPIYFVSIQFDVQFFFVQNYRKDPTITSMSLVFSFVILQLPMLANYKNLTKEKLYDVLEIFVSSVLVGGSTVYVAFSIVCFLS